MNKKTMLLVAGILVLVSVGAFLYFSHSASAAVGNLDIYTGSADVVRGSATITGTTGIGISLSDEISVASGSRVAIILKDGTEVRLESGTKVTVSDITYNGQKLEKAIFDLHTGEAWAHVSPLAPGGTFDVETPTIVATVRGTDFDVLYDGTLSHILVSTHAVWVALRSNPTNTIQVNAGYGITIHDASTTADFAAGAQVDTTQNDWVLFNGNLNAATSSTTTNSTGSSTSMKDLFAAGASQECTFTDDTADANVSGIIYVTRGHMRGDFTVVASGGTIQSHLITDGQTAYAWTDQKSRGLEMPFTFMDQTSSSSDDVSADEKTNYACNPWIVDQSEFTLPANITFAEVKTTINSGGTAPANNSMQCAECDQTPNAAGRAACKTLLGCP